MGELDTEVKGDPATLTSTAQWMRARCVSLEDIAHAFTSARGESEAEWVGEAGDNLRELLTEGDKMANSATMLITSMLTQLETHQDDLSTVHGEMQRARDVAAAGGLAMHGFKIQEPGPAPADPGGLPSSPTPQQKNDHAALTEANAAYTDKVRAYTQAAEIVELARKKENDSQAKVVQFLSGTFDPAKFALTLGDISGGVTAAVAARTSQWRSIAAQVKSPALASKMAADSIMSPAGKLKAAAIAAERTMEKKYALSMAQATRASRFVDKYVPPRVAKALDAKVYAPKAPSSLFAKGAAKVLGKIPWVGVGFTAAGVGVDVLQGKDATQSIVSNGSGMVAGALIGTCIGGPIGAVVGGVAGVGVGFAVDAIWSAVDG